jgi:serine/threonine-protein kinase RsbW
MQKIEFKIDSTLEQVSLVGVSITALCKYNDVDDMVCFQLETAAVEAMNNAIIHAYKNKPGKVVNIKWCYDASTITIDISDTGETMKAPMPDTLIEQDSEHGRGWFIMREWTDDLSYTSKNGINTVTLKKYF